MMAMAESARGLIGAGSSRADRKRRSLSARVLQVDMRAHFVDLVVPIARDPSGIPSRLLHLNNLPSVGRALLFDLVLVTVLHLPGDRACEPNQPHLAISQPYRWGRQVTINWSPCRSRTRYPSLTTRWLSGHFD